MTDFAPVSLDDLESGPDFGLPVTEDGYRAIRISHLRDCLGMTCQWVAQTDEPLVVQRYSRQDVIIVPLWEWRFLQEVADEVRLREEIEQDSDVDD